MTIASLSTESLERAVRTADGGQRVQPHVRTLVVELPRDSPTHVADWTKLDELAQYTGMDEKTYRAAPNKVKLDVCHAWMYVVDEEDVVWWT